MDAGLPGQLRCPVEGHGRGSDFSGQIMYPFIQDLHLLPPAQADEPFDIVLDEARRVHVLIELDADVDIGDARIGNDFAEPLQGQAFFKVSW